MDGQIRVLGVITARGGSKGIPGKNIKLLAGKPLIAWTIESALKSKALTDVVVSTDDEEIARVAKEWGADVPFMRPPELAEDATPHLPVMRHAVETVEGMRNTRYDYAVILQPTSPFRRAQYIDDTVSLLRRESTDSAVTVYEIDNKMHPVRVKKLINNRVLPYCLEEPTSYRRQDYPAAYKRSSDVYCMTRACLIEQESLYGTSTAGLIVPSDFVIDIDTPLDWMIAEELAKSWKSDV